MPDTDVLDRLAVLTGLGWTTSILGYLTTVVAHGTSLAPRLVTDPRPLLYVGGVLFVATLGLDRLQNRVSNGDRPPPDDP